MSQSEGNKGLEGYSHAPPSQQVSHRGISQMCLCVCTLWDYQQKPFYTQKAGLYLLWLSRDVTTAELYLPMLQKFTI